MAEKQSAAGIMELLEASLRWQQDNYWQVWANVYKSYRCFTEVAIDPKTGKPDPDKLAKVATPLTPAFVNRLVARVTAQTPNPRYQTKERPRSDRISRALMYQWDKGHAQRSLKQAVRQTGIFGWAVRYWNWRRDSWIRNRRVDPLDDDPAVVRQIDNTYGTEIQEEFGFTFKDLSVIPQGPDDLSPRHQAAVKLIERHGKGGLVKVGYQYNAYEGPAGDLISIADCYPEPNFRSIRKSNWFILRQRVNRQDLDLLVNRYPGLKDGVEKLLVDYPNGTPPYQFSRGTSDRGTNFRAYMAEAYPGSRFNEEYFSEEGTGYWDITEKHTINRKDQAIDFVGGEDQYLGQVEKPFEWGESPFAELIFISDLLGGIGESLPRWFQGLQDLYDRQVNARWQLIDNILRPIIGTSNRQLAEDPKLVKRGDGFRLVYMRGPHEMWQQGEQAALAAASQGLADSSSILMLYQMLTGETNTSLAANADPSQSRTATGAKLIAFTQDLTSREQIGQLNEFLSDEHRFMYELNRQELVKPMTFDGGPYRRQFEGTAPEQEQEGSDWLEVDPRDFQDEDGQIVVELGSTLADDDQARFGQAMQLFQMFGNDPTMNGRKIREDVLIAHGKGNRLGDYFAPPQPPMPPPPQPPRATASFAFKGETMLPHEREAVMREVGIDLPTIPPQLPGAPLPPGMTTSGEPPLLGSPAGAMPPPMPPNMPTLSKEMMAPPQPPPQPSALEAASKGLPQ